VDVSRSVREHSCGAKRAAEHVVPAQENLEV